MCKKLQTKSSILSVITLSLLSILLMACEKEEQYATATINGIEYAEIKVSHPLNKGRPSSIIIVEDCDVAIYHTALKPLTKGHPNFELNFLIALKEIKELEINKSYRIWGVRQLEEYNWVFAVDRMEENLPNNYDGVTYCYKDGVDESLFIDGILKLERYETEEQDGESLKFYYGSYQLANSSEKDEKLDIKANFKTAEVKTRLND